MPECAMLIASAKTTAGKNTILAGPKKNFQANTTIPHTTHHHPSPTIKAPLNIKN